MPPALGSNSVIAPTTSSSAPSISPTGASVPFLMRPEAARSCSREHLAEVAALEDDEAVGVEERRREHVAHALADLVAPFALLSVNFETAMRALGPL